MIIVIIVNQMETSIKSIDICAVVLGAESICKLIRFRMSHIICNHVLAWQTTLADLRTAGSSCHPFLRGRRFLHDFLVFIASLVPHHHERLAQFMFHTIN